MDDDTLVLVIWEPHVIKVFKVEGIQTLKVEVEEPPLCNPK